MPKVFKWINFNSLSLSLSLSLSPPLSLSPQINNFCFNLFIFNESLWEVFYSKIKIWFQFIYLVFESIEKKNSFVLKDRVLQKWHIYEGWYAIKTKKPKWHIIVLFYKMVFRIDACIATSGIHSIFMIFFFLLFF